MVTLVSAAGGAASVENISRVVALLSPLCDSMGGGASSISTTTLSVVATEVERGGDTAYRGGGNTQC